MRSPICLGPKSITTIPGTDTAILFEGYFDFLSFIELKLYKGQSVIVLNTTAKVKAGIEKIKRNFRNAKIECYLDNDGAGNEATQKIMEAYPFIKDKRWIYSGFKDLNELLVSKVTRENKLANAPEASHVLVRPKRLLP
jgi:DNA primase